MFVVTNTQNRYDKDRKGIPLLSTRMNAQFEWKWERRRLPGATISIQFLNQSRFGHRLFQGIQAFRTLPPNSVWICRENLDWVRNGKPNQEIWGTARIASGFTADAHFALVWFELILSNQIRTWQQGEAKNANHKIFTPISIGSHLHFYRPHCCSVLHSNAPS